MKENLHIGKREKVLHLDKNLSAVKIGNFLQFKKYTKFDTDFDNDKHPSKLRRLKEIDVDNDNDLHCNKNLVEVSVLEGLSYICDEVSEFSGNHEYNFC